MSCVTFGSTPPQDKSYQNLCVKNTIVTKNLVACNLQGGTLTVDNLKVTNTASLPVDPTSSGTYEPQVISFTGLSFVDPLDPIVARYTRVGEVITVYGSVNIQTMGVPPRTLNISLPFPAQATTEGFPVGTCTWIQVPLFSSRGAGVVYPFQSLSQTAEIYLQSPGGSTGPLVFTFSYFAA